MTAAASIDPVDYEIIAHRLWAIGEEGRIALQRVTASPIVAQGGECMSSFYDANGTMILACSGHLRFSAATSDAIRKLIEWYDESPGIHEGDEFFFNDPYVAGSHTYDIMQIAPIFWNGRRVAWVASSSHTADTGGVLRGGATEIYHEGIRILGLKIVDGGLFREDVFRTIVEQCRDPEYVGMDLKSRTAANNVCIRGFHALVEKFGIDFVLSVGERLIADSERMARTKLSGIPDGVWRGRSYGSAIDQATRTAEPYQVVCTATKRGDSLVLDFAGSSGQLSSDQNSTLPSTAAHVAIAITNHLFWDVPWSDGKMRPVEIVVPEGSVLHCTYPAASGRAPWVGNNVVAAVSECLSKMLYAAGARSDVNASWGSFWYLGGPGYFYGGRNARGLPVAQGLYDIHGGGLGAAATRDGVLTGGNMNIPSGGISDVERIELQYPFLYFARNHNTDGGGFGRFNGGNGSSRLFMVRGSRDLSVDFLPYGGLPQGAFGLFGGYPVGTGGVRAVLQPSEELPRSMEHGEYPVDADEGLSDALLQVEVSPHSPSRLPVPEGYLLSDFVQGGGGFGDPLDRDPALVAQDVALRLLRSQTAERIFGVVLGQDEVVDEGATRRSRTAIREARLRGSTRQPASLIEDEEEGWRPTVRFHEYLALGSSAGGSTSIRCLRCQHRLCAGDENYKLHVPRTVRSLRDFAERDLPDGSPYLAVLHEYACPGCATLLQVDVYCAEVGGEEDLWDVQILQ